MSHKTELCGLYKFVRSFETHVIDGGSSDADEDKPHHVEVE